MYIFWFLHQTTTAICLISFIKGCISFDSYIKPQRYRRLVNLLLSCISFDSYIKPQPLAPSLASGTGCISFDSYIKPQRLLWSLWRVPCCISFDSYIKPQLILTTLTKMLVVYLLIPTSNHNKPSTINLTMPLYIFWFLHQTTTKVWTLNKRVCCISFDSYIKPQHFLVIMITI